MPAYYNSCLTLIHEKHEYLDFPTHTERRFYERGDKMPYKVLKTKRDDTETMQESGMKYVRYLGNKQHLLIQKSEHIEDQRLEVWTSNKDFSGYGIIYKNTRLEFSHSYTDAKKEDY